MKYRLLLDVSPRMRRGAIVDWSRPVVTALAAQLGKQPHEVAFPVAWGRSYLDTEEAQHGTPEVG